MRSESSVLVIAVRGSSSCRTSLKVRSRGAQPSDWTAYNVGRSASTPRSAASERAWTVELARAPPPTWMNSRQVPAPGSAGPARSEANSNPRVRPPSMVIRFSVPWHVNGTAPPATSSRERRTHGSPISSSRRSQTVTRAPRSSSLASTVASAHVGTWTVRGLRAACAMTAAARAALPQDAMTSGVSVGVSSTSRWRASPNRCLALWVPETLPVSSFPTIRPVWPMAEPTVLRSTRGVCLNPVPSISATASSSRRTMSTKAASLIPASMARWWDQSMVL